MKNLEVSVEETTKPDQIDTHLANVATNTTLTAHDCKRTALLATAWIYVQTPWAGRVLTRALVDQGAQSSFISGELCQTLRLERHPVKVQISGVGGNKAFLCRGVVCFIIKPHFKSEFHCEVTAYEVKTPRLFVNTQTSNIKLNEILRKLWEVEELPRQEKPLTKDELVGEEYYQQTVTRNPDGRLVVRLPVKPEFVAASGLGDSFTG